MERRSSLGGRIFAAIMCGAIGVLLIVLIIALGNSSFYGWSARLQNSLEVLIPLLRLVLLFASFGMWGLGVGCLAYPGTEFRGLRYGLVLCAALICQAILFAIFFAAFSQRH